MGWLEKIFGGSTHRISGGQYHGGYEGAQYHGGYDGGQYHSGHEGEQYHGGYQDSTTWEEPTTSVDESSDFDKEEIDRAIALSLAEEDQKGKKVIESEPHLEEDEALAKALQESLNVESSPPPPPPRYDYGSPFPSLSYSFPYGYRVCAGCNAEIGHGRYLSCMGAVWHPECFRCHGCNQPISDYEFSMSDNRPYHKSCYKEQHHPKCDVCKSFIPTNPAGLIEYRAHPFWLQKYCPSHETDGTPRCCSCERMEPVDARYLILEDGRKLCLECLDSSIMDTHECQPLYLEIQEFYEGLNMKVEQQIPLLLVERQALNEAMEGEKNGHHHMPETRGLCLSEEQTISSISRRPRIGGYRILDMFTEPYRLIRHCEVTAILILYGLPRLLTGSILAHEMMHAWLRLKGYPSLSPEVEEGICQVLAHMWLDSEIIAGSGSTSTSASTSASSSSSSSPSTSSGFKLEVVKTTSAGHARKLASTVDFSTCPDGIICVGGDGIVNEVLNGLLTRDNQKEAISVPIGIIPAGSDNSLVWTVLGVRDPVSAAIAIVKGGLTPTDVFAVEWVQSGRIHFGSTVTYFGFVSDVLELSEKYQKRFGPLRYFVAGFLKFMCLPKYNFEVEYLPALKEATGEGKASVIDMSELYTDIMRRSSKEGLPRASSLSSIDSIMTPSRMSGADLDTTCSSTEPSEYVRAIDAKSKRLSAGRSGNTTSEPEVIHPQVPHSVTPNWPRTRSKSKTDKGWAGLTAANDLTRSSWANTTTNDKEDISSTMSDPGPIWDAEPRWDTEPHWNIENPIELPGPAEDTEDVVRKDIVHKAAEEWVSTKGQFLGVLVCNHSCKTVQSLSSQVVAPKAEPDDNTLDLLLVHGSGRLKLIRFFLLLQMGRHLSLPYVEYVKVKAVKVKPGKHSNSSCGIDGELFPVNEQVISSLLPEQCRLIGRPPGNCK